MSRDSERFLKFFPLSSECTELLASVTSHREARASRHTSSHGVAGSVIGEKSGTLLTPYKRMTLKHFAEGKFTANGIGYEEQRLLACSLITSYDLFISQCKERNFTPTFNLYTLWAECQRAEAIAGEINAN